MDCPRCKLVNPPTAQRCDCGYDFETGRVRGSYAAAALQARNPDASAWLHATSQKDIRQGWTWLGLAVLWIAVTGLAGSPSIMVPAFPALIHGSHLLRRGLRSRKLVDAGVRWEVDRSLGADGADGPPAARLVVADDPFAWLRPPDDTTDPAPWDRYWQEQVAHNLAPRLFDMFCDDDDLVEEMTRRGVKRVLCAGNGFSQEPRALARAGFDVVALDLSPVATKLAQAWAPPSEELDRIVPPGHHQPGGRVEYVVGSILDAAACPGPFGAVIERRTLQLFRGDSRARAFDALVERLAADGLFFSHCHDGAWKPPRRPFHATESLFRASGWEIVDGGTRAVPAGRCAWLFLSTG